jgi:hypothetical protein
VEPHLTWLWTSKALTGLFDLAGRVVGLIERAVINVFIALILSLMFILIGQPGVDWLLVSPVFATIGKVGVIVPVRAFLRSKTFRIK